MNAMPRRQFIRKTATAALAAPFISTAATRALAAMSAGAATAWT